MSWAGQHSREAHDAQVADMAAWGVAVSDTAWLSSLELESSKPRPPCSVEDEAPGHVEWKYTGSDWPKASSSIRGRLAREGWVEGADVTDGYVVMSRMTSARQTSLSLSTQKTPTDNVFAALDLQPVSCPLR
ncbi:hypothetical protein GCM10009740_16930 [Terrabacter terrae]|uniref:Uncharacterized protein n=1 Tax=Terrabacter terrae TaxID=318434 RepID=A0ABN2U3J0_9MICO